MRKQYYKCLKFIDGEAHIHYWHTSNPLTIMRCYDAILPLGSRKPTNIPAEEIRT